MQVALGSDTMTRLSHDDRRLIAEAILREGQLPPEMRELLFP